MISENLPRIVPSMTHDPSEAAEANMLCYLASYNGEGITSRVVNSFKRAFGMDEIEFFPRVVDGRPAMAVAYYRGTDAQRVIVASEGITTSDQRLFVTRAPAAVTVGTLSGRVYDAFATLAAAQRTALLASTTWVTASVRRNTQMTFAGFSLGAATSEINSYFWNGVYAWAGIRLFKFGCPRIGNQRWQENRSPRVQASNYICSDDPISSFPFYSSTRFTDTFSSVPTLWTNLQRDPRALRFTRAGRFLGSYGSVNEVSCMALLGLTNDAIAPDSVWYDHDIRMYRLMFNNWADTYNPLTLYRLRYLEFPDHNSFGGAYAHQVERVASLFELLDPVPDDVFAPTAQIRNIIAREAERDQFAAQEGGGGGDWGGADAGDSGGGGDWGNETPQTTRLRRQRVR